MEDLKILRDKTDKIDDEIVTLLLKRMACSKAIGEVKKSLSVPVTDLKREDEIINRLTLNKKESEAELIKDVYNLIFAYSKSLQK